jgi:hypothetical protein
MADVFVRNRSENEYNCEISFKYKKQHMNVHYTLRTTVDRSDYIVFHQPTVEADLDCARLARHILVRFAGIPNPKDELVDEVAEALEYVLPPTIIWQLN